MKLSKLFLLILICLPVSAQAARFSFSSSQVSAPPGATVSVDVLLDNQGESVNAIEGQLNFPSDKLTLQEIKSGDSIVSVWLKSPAAEPDGHIAFAGIMPGGFSGVLSPFYTGGRPGKIFSLIFLIRAPGEGKVEWQEPSALLNDGTGRSAEVTAEALTISSALGVINSAPLPGKLAPDAVAPEVFTPEIARDQNLFDNQWFVVFTTRDNDSGVASYEVKEGDNQWQEATSPHLLADQTRTNPVSVRARDHAGNERVVTLPPESTTGRYLGQTFWFIILLCFVALFSYLYYSHSRRR